MASASRSRRGFRARDAQLITSDEDGDAEHWTAYAGAAVHVLIGAFFVYIGL